MYRKTLLLGLVVLCVAIGVCAAVPIEKRQMPPVACNQPGEWVKSPWDRCNLCFCSPNEVSTICTQRSCSSRRNGRSVEAASVEAASMEAAPVEAV